MGGGMVDPNVLKAVGYDPEVYTGFAAGFGVERFAMVLHQIDDIRPLYTNYLNFLRQFVKSFCKFIFLMGAIAIKIY
jgi:phenylalanyl-tRNA synthetase alpha chain